MKNEELEERFKQLDLDYLEPEKGHKERFLKKLEDTKALQKKNTSAQQNWMKILAIAASVVIVLTTAGMALNFNFQQKEGDLASVSPQMKQTQQFYTSLIEKELKKIQEVDSPETKAVVEDALKQMEKLDAEYAKLKNDLIKSGKDNRVIHAMISNFQQRIDLLNNVLSKIEELQSLKSKNYEDQII